jgi:hypothetical protein
MNTLMALFLVALFIAVVLAAAQVLVYVFCGILCVFAGCVVFSLIADTIRQIRKGK